MVRRDLHFRPRAATAAAPGGVCITNAPVGEGCLWVEECAHERGLCLVCVKGKDL